MSPQKTIIIQIQILIIGIIKHINKTTDNFQNIMGVIKMMDYSTYGKTKKQVCTENESFAYYSGFGGLELKHIEYGIEDYIYAVSGAWCSDKSYHKLKVYYGENDSYIKLHGYKIPMNECIKM